MNWEALGTIAEIVGAIAVVASLIYLAVQIRVQNRESRMAAVHDILEAFRSIQFPVQDAETAKLWIKAVSDYDSLKDYEKMQMMAVVGPMIRVWEEAYFQFQSGRLDREIWDTMVTQFSDLMATPMYVKFWDIRKHVYSKRFTAFVNDLEIGQYKLE